MESLGHYTLNERVGADRLSEIYRATDTALGRTVILRILRPDIAADSARRKVLVTAARARLSLSHPNIAALFHVGEENGRTFLVFEHAPGETLGATLAGSPLNVRRAVDLGGQIADALADAHAQGLFHGALGPDAIVLTQKGRVKVTGFGLPSIPPGHPIQSDTSLLPAEIACVAPERVLGAAGDARADIFSLGCILFEMLTGKQPFASATGADTVVAILSHTPPPVSQVNPEVPEALDDLVQRCLVKSVEGRCDSAATIAAGLREVAARLEAAEPADAVMPALPARAPRRRRGWLIVVLILACLAALAAAALLR